jgi:hypothetical protein
MQRSAQRPKSSPPPPPLPVGARSTRKQQLRCRAAAARSRRAPSADANSRGDVASRCAALQPTTRPGAAAGACARACAARSPDARLRARTLTCARARTLRSQRRAPPGLTPSLPSLPRVRCCARARLADKRARIRAAAALRALRMRACIVRTAASADSRTFVPFSSLDVLPPQAARASAPGHWRCAGAAAARDGTCGNAERDTEGSDARLDFVGRLPPGAQDVRMRAQAGETDTYNAKVDKQTSCVQFWLSRAALVASCAPGKPRAPLPLVHCSGACTWSIACATPYKGSRACDGRASTRRMNKQQWRARGCEHASLRSCSRCCTGPHHCWQARSLSRRRGSALRTRACIARTAAQHTDLRALSALRSAALRRRHAPRRHGTGAASARPRRTTAGASVCSSVFGVMIAFACDCPHMRKTCACGLSQASTRSSRRG